MRVTSFSGGISSYVSVPSFFSTYYDNFLLAEGAPQNFWDFTLMFRFNPLYINNNILTYWLVKGYNPYGIRVRADTASYAIPLYFIEVVWNNIVIISKSYPVQNDNFIDYWKHVTLRLRNIDINPTFNVKKNCYNLLNWEVALFVDGEKLPVHTYTKAFVPGGPSSKLYIGYGFIGMIGDYRHLWGSLSDTEITNLSLNTNDEIPDILEALSILHSATKLNTVVFNLRYGVDLTVEQKNVAPVLLNSYSTKQLGVDNPYCTRFWKTSYINVDVYPGLVLSPTDLTFKKYFNNFKIAANENEPSPYTYKTGMQYTVMLWFKPEYLDETYSELIGSTYGTNNGYIKVNNTEISLMHSYGISGVARDFINFEIGRWYHVAYTIRTVEWSDGYPFRYEWCIYINGSLSWVQYFVKKYSPSGPLGSLIIGRSFCGCISSIKLSHYCFTQEQIFLYMRELGPSNMLALRIEGSTAGGFYPWEDIAYGAVRTQQAICPIHASRYASTSVECNTLRIPIDTGFVREKITILPLNSTDRFNLSVLFNTPTAIDSYNFEYTDDILEGDMYLRVNSTKRGYYYAYISTPSGIACTVLVVVGNFVTDVTITPNTKYVEKGVEDYLFATVYPANAEDKNVAWQSNNSFVSINSITGRYATNDYGTSEITVTTEDGNYQATCTIKVCIVMLSLTLDRNNIILEKGLSTQLIPTISPENTTYKELTWSSSNSIVASVDQNGHVTALHSGSALITVSSVYGLKSYCYIEVLDAVLAFFDKDWNQLNSYSQIIKYLQIEEFIAGQTTHPQVVYVKNNSSKVLDNLELNIINPFIFAGIEVQFSSNRYNFIAVNEICYSELQPSKYKTFYVRIASSPISEGISGEFDIIGRYTYGGDS